MTPETRDTLETPRPFAAADAVIALLMICGAILTFNLVGSGRPDRVTVFRQNAIVAEYPLSANAAFSVKGLSGSLDVEIKNGSAKILRANCPRQICKRSGAVNGPHGQLICAPNNVLIQIRSAKTDHGVDAVAY